MGGALYVSPSGAAGRADRWCGSAAYSTIQSAVNGAPSGATVVVCPEIYTEHVIISSPLTLEGRDATIDATSTSVGSCGPLGLCLAGVMITSSWVQISGFTVTGAVGEGILAVTFPGASPVSHLTITRNRVVGNDTGGIPEGSPDGYASAKPKAGSPATAVRGST
jgi:hypothetical protein